MRKEQFTDLLTDLYTAYNADYLKYIPSLVDKHSGGMEIESVITIFMKYNHNSAAHYDPVKSTDQYAINLAKEYSEGKRTLKNWSLKYEADRMQAENKKSALQQTEENKEKLLEQAAVEEAKNKAETERIENLKSGIGEQVSEQLQETTRKFAEREKEIFAKYETKIQKLENKLNEEDVEIQINTNYTESELKIPNTSMLRSLGVGTRMIIENAEGKPIGMEVIDVVYDAVSHPEGITVIEITIDRK